MLQCTPTWQNNKGKKEINERQKNGKEEIKLFLFEDDIILYVKELNDPIRRV
jgi:hypothetical protein